MPTATPVQPPPLLPPSLALAPPAQRPVLPSMPAAAASGGVAMQAFEVGGLGLLVRFEHGQELSELPPVTALPHAPGWLRGVANLHGLLVPVVDLAGWAALAAAGRSGRPMLLVLGHGEDAAGFVIDGLPQRLRFGADAAADPATAPPALAGLVAGAALVGERLWFELDVPRLLQAVEDALAPA